MKNFIRNLIIVSLVSLLLHFVWEYWQCDIFYTMEMTTNHTLLMLSATFGDVMMTIVLYLLLTITNRNSNWFINTWHLNDTIVMVLYALFFSFYFEISALYTNRWGYSSLMPLFPNTNIGLVPVVQLVILFPITFVLSKYIIRVINKI